MKIRQLCIFVVNVPIKPNYYNFCLLVLFIAVFYIPVYGQYEYKEAETYKLYLENSANLYAQQFDKNIRKQYSDVISVKNNELIDRLTAGNFLFDTLARPYLNSIFSHILLSNSLNSAHYHFFIDRTSEVNAYSFEDGTIVCNLGLLAGMENESQLAMVFCHEIAHYLLMHSNNAIVNRLTKYNSREFLAKIKQIKTQEYNTKKQLESLLMTDVFDRSRHSRLQERAADSLGMILFSKTRYSGKTIPHIFDFLKSATALTNAITIQSFFDKEKFKVDDLAEILLVKRMRFGTAEKKEIADSLKTHPDCDKRKKEMQEFFMLKPKPGEDFITGSLEKLNNVKKLALFEEAKYAKDNGNLGLYLYHLIQNDALFPANRQIKSEIYNTLTSLYKHQQSHTFQEVVHPSYIPENENDQYAALLKILDNLNLKQLDELVKTYYTNNNVFITIAKN